MVLLVGLAAFCGLCLAEDSPPANASFDEVLKPFLKQYCVRCHGAEQQKADRRFDTLASSITDDDSLIDYQDALDLLNLSEMPPTNAKQPTDRERQKVIKWLTAKIAKYHQSQDHSAGQSVLRRLNRREYRNTIRDLLHIDTTIFDPTTTFPRDQTNEHLDNVGESLVTSSYLMVRYLEAAEAAIDKALLPLERPKTQTWIFEDGFRQQPEIDQVHRKTNGYAHMTLYDVPGADKPEGAYGPIHAFAEGVPFDGTYEIRLRAEAVNRLHPYDDDFLGRDRTEPLRLGIVAGNYRVGDLHLKQPIQPQLAEFELADEPRWYTVRVHLDAGYTPRFTFPNGLMDARSLWSRLIRKYPDQFAKGLQGIVALRFNAIKYGKLPHIRIHEIEIKGPIYETWPRESQRAILGDQAASILKERTITEAVIRRQIKSFASRAYRRPATPEEVDRMMHVVRIRSTGGRKPLEAFSDGLKAVLCSPNFLYLEESSPEQLSETALASRLAYFLWSSMPDSKLLQLAASGQLSRPQTLQEQVERMLCDPRASAFVDGFLDSWLTLRDLGSAPPDRGAFRDFYQYDLGTAMRQETRLFTKHVIDENLSINNFIDSEFTFVNKPLARHYGMPLPKSSNFERVNLTDPRRGGLLGQASVLTVTANGIDTSPVVRGVWLLENLLGTPPSPPPPDIEPLDPDVRGAKSIRDQLKRHRDTATCNECHRKIDPLGFALENFDAIGGWRSTYPKRIAIDTSGKLPDGSAFKNVEEFKQVLLKRKDQFARAFTEKMLAYALGRQAVPSDRPHIDQILQKSEGHLRDIIKEIVASDPFLAP